MHRALKVVHVFFCAYIRHFLPLPSKMAFISSDLIAFVVNARCAMVVPRNLSDRSLLCTKLRGIWVKLVSRLSTKVIALSEFSSRSKHSKDLLGKTVCCGAEEMTTQLGKLVEFYDIRAR